MIYNKGINKWNNKTENLFELGQKISTQERNLTFVGTYVGLF